MNKGEIIYFIILLMVSLSAFIISCFQFKQKGFLFNNAYLYASKKEREKMDKKPHYRQSAIVFLLVGIEFLFLAIDVIFPTKWVDYVILLLISSILIYAIVSSSNIVKK